MKLSQVEVKNFRLLKDVRLLIDEGTTVVVGRNNSGKTSLAELFRRVLSDSAPSFELQDFSMSVQEEFWSAFEAHTAGGEAEVVRKLLPKISLRLVITYGVAEPDLGHLSDFIIDLNPACAEAHALVTFELASGKLDSMFNIAGFDPQSPIAAQKQAFFSALKESVPRLYHCTLLAVDPNDLTNQKAMEWGQLRQLMQGDLISAQRGLDDVTHKDNDALGKILSSLFGTASSDTSSQSDQDTAAALKNAVIGVQSGIDTDFRVQLQKLLPAFQLFNYPGLADPKLIPETILNVDSLLKNHTKIRYSGTNDINLPEAYNGLGTRNLIYILLKLLEAFKSYKARPVAPSVHIVFIEEPEAHLHPQMQEVFINQLKLIAAAFSNMDGGAPAPWPVQFVVTTHSSHVANKASFDSMRYFLARSDAGQSTRTTKIKDLKQGFSTIPLAENKFLHQYMTLTKCDLLFADKAILIEGTTERFLMPRILEKVDAQQPPEKQLSSQYVSIVEVGGAYAHLFFKLLDFLELRTLIITDLDTVDAGDNNKACKVSLGTDTSNVCIKTWFPNCTAPEIRVKTDEEKAVLRRRIAYQIPEAENGVCGRSFEDAFMLANAGIFPDLDANNLEDSSWVAAQKAKKSAFALRHAIEEPAWIVPRYIREGLVWLGDDAEHGAQPQAQAAA